MEVLNIRISGAQSNACKSLRWHLSGRIVIANMFYIHFICTNIVYTYNTSLLHFSSTMLSQNFHGNKWASHIQQALSIYAFYISHYFIALHICMHLCKVLHANLSFVLLAIMLFAQFFCNLISTIMPSTKTLFSTKFLVYVCAGNDRTQMITI